MKMLNTTACIASLALVATVVGCGGAPPPNEKVASSEAAIRGAQEVGAPNVPQAALHLKLAQEELAKAKSQISDNDNEKAEYTLMRAQADAELALALAKESSARAQAQQAMDQVKSLRGNK